MKKLSILFGFTLILTACGGDDTTDGAAATDGAGTETTDSTDGTDSTDSTDSTDGTDGTESTESTGIPDCPFKPPIGASCNPYPGCPGDGCTDEEICTLVIYGEKKRIECHLAGSVGPGGACDHEAGPYCEEGVCVDGECRGFCVDNPDCPNNSACQQMLGVPGKPTVCGAAQADCDPLDAGNSCPAGLICYYQHANGTTDCLETKQNGTDDSDCDCTNCCAPGYTCVNIDAETRKCSRTCNSGTEGENLCSELCAGKTTKALTTELGACVEGGEPPPPPPPPPPSCDLLAQDCEGAAQACYTSNDGPVCLAKGNKPAGAKCDKSNDCAPGSVCHASKCYEVCDPKDPTNAMCTEGIQVQCSNLPGSGNAGFCG